MPLHVNHLPAEDSLALSSCLWFHKAATKLENVVWYKLTEGLRLKMLNMF